MKNIELQKSRLFCYENLVNQACKGTDELIKA